MPPASARLHASISAFAAARVAALLVVAALGGAPTASAATQVLIPINATWRYLDDGSNQGTAWTAPAFDDSAWAQGPAQLGYGDGDEATVVSFGPNASQKYVTTYFRHTFNVANPAAWVALRLDLLRDDGAVVYLNGTEIARTNMPAFPISYLTFASSAAGGAQEDALHPYALDTSLLQVGANVLAVEVHQASLTSSDISFARLRAETTPIVVREPYLQSAGHDRVTFRWRTAGATDSQVWIGASPATLAPAAADPTPGFEHEVTVTGLTAATQYHYAVGSTAQALAGGDAQSRFRTPPLPGARVPFRVWAIGDAGTGDAFAAAVRDAWIGYNGAAAPDVWLMLGDNAYENGEDNEYQISVFDTYPSVLRQGLLWTTRGNHDRSFPAYYGNFSLPAAGQTGGVASGTEAWYSFDYANVHFICLDSFGSNRAVGGPMWTWLQADLQATAQDWIVAFWHHPPYTKGSHDSDTESNLIDMRQNFLPLLEDGGVDLVLCGHSHSYERSHLLDGHHGSSATLAPGMIRDTGDGDPAGDGPYVKTDLEHTGAVYTVAGSSGKTSAGPLNHPVMAYSAQKLGSVVLDFDDDRVVAVFLNAAGQVDDTYTLRKLRTDGGLASDATTVSATSGGAAQLALDAGPARAGHAYYLLGSVTGDEPGFTYQGVHVPLNFDAYSNLVLGFANSPVFPGSIGVLDGAGQAQAGIVFPGALISPAAVGLTLYHAFLTVDANGSGLASFASNAVPLTFLP